MQNVYECCPQLRSDYETAAQQATERLQALRELGFVASEKVLVGGDGTRYGDYYILEDK